MDFPESTVWKNKLFRDDNSTHLDNSSNEHPDVTCITKKINIIKKQRQYVENFNHMKPLANVYEEPFAEDDPDADGEKEPFAEHDGGLEDADNEGDEEPFTQDDGDDDDEELFTTEKIESLKGRKKIKIKGIRMKPIRIPTKKESKKRYLDNKKKGEKFIADNLKKKADFEKGVFDKFYNIFFFIPNWIDKQIKNGCYSFTSTFSSVENIKKDSENLHIILSYSISYLISIYVAYNWFFLLAYIDKNATGFDETLKENFRPASNMNRMKIPPEIIESYPEFKGVYYFLLEFVTAPLWVVDQFFLGDSSFPKLFSIIPYRIISRFLILIFSFIMVYSVNLSDSIRRVVFGNTTIHLLYFTIACTLIILYQLVTSFYANFKIDRTKTIHTINIGTVETISRTTSGYFALVCYYILRFIIAVLSINISIIVSILFFWFHSMVGMCLYSGNTKFYRIDVLMKIVDDYINEDLSQFKNNDEECIEPSIIQKIINFIVKFLYKNLYLFVYFLVLVASIQKSMSGFNSTSLQQIVSSLIFVLMVIVCLFMYGNMG